MRLINKILIFELILCWSCFFIFFFIFSSLLIQTIFNEKLFAFIRESYSIDSSLLLIFQKILNGNETILNFFESNITKVYFFVELPLIFSFISVTYYILRVLSSYRFRKECLSSLYFKLLLASLFPLPLLIMRSFEIYETSVLSIFVILEFLTILLLSKFNKKILKSVKSHKEIFYSYSFYTKIGAVIFFIKFVIDILVKGFLLDFFLTTLFAELNCFICILIMNKIYHFYKKYSSLSENDKLENRKDVFMIEKRSIMNKVLITISWIFFILILLHIIFAPTFSKLSSPLNYTSFYASYYGWEKVLKFLVKNGVDVNIRINGRTLLQIAIHQKHKQITTFLIRNGANVNVEDGMGWTPLHHTTKDNHKEITDILVKNGADINARGKEFGFTPLHLAVADSRKETVLFLMENKADVNIKDNEGRTPLDIAKIKKDNKIMDVLKTTFQQ